MMLFLPIFVCVCLYFLTRVVLIVVSDELWKEKRKKLDQKRAHIHTVCETGAQTIRYKRERNQHHLKINVEKTAMANAGTEWKLN